MFWWENTACNHEFCLFTRKRHRTPLKYRWVAKLNIRLPAPSWATSSRSFWVLADAIASGSLSVKGRTSLHETWMKKVMTVTELKKKPKCEKYNIRKIIKTWSGAATKETFVESVHCAQFCSCPQLTLIPPYKNDDAINLVGKTKPEHWHKEKWK